MTEHTALEPQPSLPASARGALINVLLAILAIDLLACGIICARQMLRPVPQLPSYLDDDPLFAEECRRAARDARDGGATEWMTMAQALLGHGHYDHALACFRHVVELNPDDLDARFAIGFCLERTGHLDESLREYLPLLELAKTTGHAQTLGQFALYDSGKNYLRSERGDEALKTFERMTDFLPADYQRAKLLLRSGQIDSALAIIEPPLQEFPQSREFRYLEFRARVARQDIEGARQSADLIERSQRGIRLNFVPDYIQAYRVQYGIDRVVESCATLWQDKNSKLLEARLLELRSAIGQMQTSQTKALLFNFAQLAIDRRRPDLLSQTLQQLRDFEVENAQVLWLEGALLELQGKTADAIPLWERSLRMSPDASRHGSLAKWYESIGDTEQYRRHSSQAHLMQARDYYRNDQLEAALLHINRAAEQSPESAEIWYYVGQINRASGQEEIAQQAYKKCLSLDAFHSRAREWIKSVVE